MSRKIGRVLSIDIIQHALARESGRFLRALPPLALSRSLCAVLRVRLRAALRAASARLCARRGCGGPWWAREAHVGRSCELVMASASRAAVSCALGSPTASRRVLNNTDGSAEVLNSTGGSAEMLNTSPREVLNMLNTSPRELLMCNSGTPI